jgi:hypothetical protein
LLAEGRRINAEGLRDAERAENREKIKNVYAGFVCGSAGDDDYKRDLLGIVGEHV